MEPCPKQAKINPSVSRLCFWRERNYLLRLFFLFQVSKERKKNIYQISGWKIRDGDKNWIPTKVSREKEAKLERKKKVV